jgi:hypothetical protein
MIPSLTYEGPLTLTKGALISNRNFRSTDGTPVIIPNTSEVVIFTDCIFAGNGDDIVKCPGYTSLVFIRCSFYADANIKGNQGAKAINDYKPRYLRVENCYIEGGSGILAEQLDETAANTHTIIIRYNRFRNISKAKPDGSDGAQHCHAIQLSNIPGLKASSEISWNECINEPGKSWVEDIINISSSGAVVDAPLLIHDNYLQGAYPLDLKSPFTGSGLTVEGSSAFVLAYKNQVVDCMNACMNIAGGDNILFYDNDMVSAALQGDGSLYWAGCYQDKSATNSSIKGNRIGYVHKGVNYKFSDRQDEMNDRTKNAMAADQNTYLPNPITVATETAQLSAWKAKTAALVIGPAAPVPVYDLTMVVGERWRLDIKPVDKDGNAAGIQPNSLYYVNFNARLTQTLSETSDVYLAAAPGSGTASVYFTSLGGKVITKTFTYMITAAPSPAPGPSQPEAVDMTFAFTKL